MKSLLFFLLLSTICFSQKFSFIYETKYTLNHQKPDDLDSDNMILDLENNTSIFRESQDKKTDSITLNNGNGMFRMGVENQFYVKKNLKQNKNLISLNNECYFNEWESLKIFLYFCLILIILFFKSF